ncbi:D-alanine--D-alanine ligase [Candidatus Sodalis pierantonius str. SOPE]|uniref:D-alanine--D-alanine ligase n=1 Tax=Candidatus Sodalis pierantonii str. SOPE TaxID=2342 RepID=W0HH71_9GAMM|nr:D-alanine--D-alanine ligase [Candidatus Sodalis pierantonius]AHF73096.1 D-alanine--D-alanine ligase [Candidatus Sodalis pierantonius str. SOPE]
MEPRESGKLRVAVLFGGQSTEHEVSLRSSLNVIRAIDRQRYDLALIGVDKHGRWTLCDEQDYLLNPDDPAAIRLAPARRYLAVVPGQQRAQLIDAANGQPLPSIDVAFSVLHGASGEDGSVQGLLRVLNIPYAGPDVLGSAVCMDKDMTKCVLRDAGVPVTPSVTLLRTGDAAPDFDAIVSQLGLPLFIKPASQGSSVGVSKVTDRATFDAALALAFRYDAKVLVEQTITGREIETAVLGNDSPEVSVCGEILANDEFYAYDTKYLKGAQAGLVIPAPLAAPVADAIRQTARQAYLALGCSVMARVDFFLTEQGEILLNEVNTLPGFTSISMYPKLWEASGLDYPALVERLITLALARARAASLSQTER